MSSRHRLILLLTSACGAFILLCPVGGSSPTAKLGPIVSAAPPFTTSGPMIGNVASGDAALEALRRQAIGALSQLQIKNER